MQEFNQNELDVIKTALELYIQNKVVYGEDNEINRKNVDAANKALCKVLYKEASE